MSKSKMTVLDLCLCAMMIAVHIILENFLTFRIGEVIKITLSSLPFVVIGMFCGPVEGLITGLVGSFLSQLIGPYGIMITTPIWIIPGAMEGLAAGLIYKAFGRKNKVINIILTVVLADLVLVIFNWFGSYVGSVLILHDITIEGLLAVTPWRIVKWPITSLIYIIIIIPLSKSVQKYLPGDKRRLKKKSENPI